MEKILVDELFWLTCAVVMIPLHWLPYIFERINLEGGFLNAARNPQPNLNAKADWAVRAQQAHKNAVENLVLFATLVITVELLGVNNSITSTAAIAYTVSRLLYLIVYIAGIEYIRTPIFAVSIVSLITLAVEIFKSFSAIQ